MPLSAIGIISQDIERSRRFYRLLGVEFKELGENSEHFEATTESGVRLMLDSQNLIEKINPNWTKPTGSGVALCFIQKNPDQVNQIYAEIISHGFHGEKEPWDAFWGQRYSIVKDPDGNLIDIFAGLE